MRRISKKNEALEAGLNSHLLSLQSSGKRIRYTCGASGAGEEFCTPPTAVGQLQHAIVKKNSEISELTCINRFYEREVAPLKRRTMMESYEEEEESEKSIGYSTVDFEMPEEF